MMQIYAPSELAQSGDLENSVTSVRYSGCKSGGNSPSAQGSRRRTLYDIGIYCINAARYLFATNRSESVGLTANNGEERFNRDREMTGALLRFPRRTPGDVHLQLWLTGRGAIQSWSVRKAGFDWKTAMNISANEMRITVGDKRNRRTLQARNQLRQN